MCGAALSNGNGGCARQLSISTTPNSELDAIGIRTRTGLGPYPDSSQGFGVSIQSPLLYRYNSRRRRCPSLTEQLQDNMGKGAYSLWLLYRPASSLALFTVHGSLARAGKVKSQTPKVDKQEKKKTPKGRAKKRILYNRRCVPIFREKWTCITDFFLQFRERYHPPRRQTAHVSILSLLSVFSPSSHSLS